MKTPSGLRRWRIWVKAPAVGVSELTLCGRQLATSNRNGDAVLTDNVTDPMQATGSHNGVDLVGQRRDLGVVEKVRGWGENALDRI